MGLIQRHDRAGDHDPLDVTSILQSTSENAYGPVDSRFHQFLGVGLRVLGLEGRSAVDNAFDALDCFVESSRISDIGDNHKGQLSRVDVALEEGGEGGCLGGGPDGSFDVEAGVEEFA